MPFREGHSPASDRRAFDALSRLEKAVSALDINRIGTAKLDDLRKVVGAARAELNGARKSSTTQRALGVHDLAKNAAEDIRVQSLMRDAVTKSTEPEQVARAAAHISKAKGRPTAPEGYIVSDHGDLGVRKALQPYGIAGVTSPSRLGDYQSAPNLPTVARDTNNLYRQLAGAGGGLDPDFARTLAATLDAPQLDPLTFQPIQRDARGSLTPTGEPVYMRDVSDIMAPKVPEPASSDGVGLKSAQGVMIAKIRRDLVAELARIRKGR